MKAGRELDALVAEKIFGWSKSDLEINEDISHFSTDIAAAWEVVERLRSRGYRFEVRSQPQGFWVYFGEEMSAEAPTAPHAICLAALKAVGHD